MGDRVTLTKSEKKPPIVVRTETLVGDLPVGKAGWLVPWMFHVREDGEIAVWKRATVHPRAGGTVRVRLARTRSGFRVEEWPNGETLAVAAHWSPREYGVITNMTVTGPVFDELPDAAPEVDPEDRALAYAVLKGDAVAARALADKVREA